MKSVKAIFIDSEGTLRSRDKSKVIRSDVPEMISKLEDKGVPVVVATGLPRFMSRKIAEKAKTHSYLISSNGADIYNIRDNERIRSLYLNKDMLRDIYEENKGHFKFIFGVGDFEYANSVNEYNMNTTPIDDFNAINEGIIQCHISQINHDLSTLLSENLDDKDLTLLSNILGNNMHLYYTAKRYGTNTFLDSEKAILTRALSFLKLVKLRLDILSKYEDKISIGNQCVDFTKFQYSGETPWFSFNQHGVSKGDAIKCLCNELSIDPMQTIAFGNDYNDISMVNNVGFFYYPHSVLGLMPQNISGCNFDSYPDGELGKVLEKVYERL